MKLSFLCIALFLKHADCQNSENERFHSVRRGNDIMWCCLNAEELSKCYEFSKTLADDQEKTSGVAFGSSYRNLKCKLYTSVTECMKVIDENNPVHPNLMMLDAGDVYLGGRYHSLVPILKEMYPTGDHVSSVAIVKKGSLPGVSSMKDLKGTKACFSGVGSLAGWTIPIYRLMEANVMEIVDCNNHVKSAINFFGDSCAVDSLQDRNNPLGDNSHKLCEICGSKEPGVRCTRRDPYSGIQGAFDCLHDKGEIAFVDIKKVTVNVSSDYELLCPDNFGSLSRSPLSEYQACAWGEAPSNALVVSSALPPFEKAAIQSFLIKALNRYSNESSESDYRITDSAPTYGSVTNLIFSDNLQSLELIKQDKQSYKSFLNELYGSSLISPHDTIEGIRRCPVDSMTLCVTSEAEMKKCIAMRTALNAQLLQPKMSCKKASNAWGCTRMIATLEADVGVMEAGDIYRAGWSNGLIPIMAEIYNIQEPYYYAVAIVKQRDNSTELIHLRRKNTCHTGVGHGAGWVIPLAWLVGNGWLRDYSCDSKRAAAEYFSKSCAPGIQSPEFVRDWEYSHLCDLCHGNGGYYCKRNHMEDYFGHTGAFRCLVEGGGDVAFVKHTTVYENCDGKRKEWWARNQLTADFELLCRDGTRAPAKDYKKCYLGTVKSNAVVTNPQHSEITINSFINLFKYSQQYYGQKVPDEFSFSMFVSEPPYADLIFQDATQQLIILPKRERDYTKYLDQEFLKAYTSVECQSGFYKSYPILWIFFILAYFLL